jgi:hypothetical protein
VHHSLSKQINMTNHSQEYQHGLIESIMLIPEDVEKRIHLRTAGQQILRLTLGMYAHCSIPFAISVAPGQEDTGRYSVMMNVDGADKELLMYLQEELTRSLKPLRRRLQPLLLESGVSQQTGKAYPPRVRCVFDIDHTQIKHIGLDGVTLRNGEFGDIRTRVNVQADVMVAGLKFICAERRYQCVFKCDTLYLSDKDTMKAGNGFPLFNTEDSFALAGALDMSGGESPLSRH